LTDLAGASEKANLDSLDNEIKELEKALHNYEQRWSNLLEAMELGEFEKDEILDRLNNIKRLRRLENLQHSTPEIKVLALDALVIKVYARGTDDVEIQGVIPLELPTIEQTSGCLPFHAYITV